MRLNARIIHGSFVLAAAMRLACGAHAQGAPSLPSNALAAAVENIGVKRCLAAVQRLSSLATSGTHANEILLDWDRKRVDASPIFAMIGLEYLNGAAALSISAIPESDGGCSVLAERVSMAPHDCKTVAGQELVGYRSIRLLPTFSVYTSAGDANSSVSLIDSPPGCMVIRRYVEFNWKMPAIEAERK